MPLYVDVMLGVDVMLESRVDGMGSGIEPAPVVALS